MDDAVQMSCSIEIDASPEQVWAVVSNIGNAANTISGIKKIEVLESATGPSIVGLTWRETREMFGREAVETMWITQATEPEFYETRAESHGSIYISRIELEPAPSGTRLTMRFDGQPVTLAAKVMWRLTGWMAKGAMRKAIDKDLADIKSSVERGSEA